MFRTLIVEDDPMVAMINERYIRRHGSFEIAGKCANGREAVQALENMAVDVVIMDMYMPVMTGLEVLRHIREKHIDVSVIMVTAANDSASIEECIRLGVTDYLVKPFSCDRLHVALNKFVAMREALDSESCLSQERIDVLLGGRADNVNELPKGIQQKTLDSITAFLEMVDGEPVTGDEVAANTGLSAVTCRRYMTYLVSSGRVKGEMNYETGGRPSMMYSLVSK